LDIFEQTGNRRHPSWHGVILKFAAVVAIVVVAWVLIAPSVDVVDSTCSQAPDSVPLLLAEHASVVAAGEWNRSAAEMLRHVAWAESRAEILDVTCTRVC
jgi:hypothetical protein